MAPAISLRAEARIKAPVEAVWTKLIDTSTWPEWNTFVPKAEPTDGSSGSQVWAIGTIRRFTADIAGTKQSLTQKVVEFKTPDESSDEPRKWRICWAIQGYPDWSFRTLRWNEIEEVGSECIYRTGEDQYGPIAWIVKMIVGNYVKRGIRDWAEDLKKASEAGNAQNAKV